MAKRDGGFSSWLQRVRRTGEHSDVTVIVEGEEFRLHLLPLLNASTYFRNLMSNANCSSSSEQKSDAASRVISISDLPGGAEGFTGAVDYCYFIKPIYTLQNVALIRAAAEFLGMADVLESTKKFLYTNVFTHWRASVGYLHLYLPLGSPVDEYIETRCLKVLVAALARAFGETKYLSAPMQLASPQQQPPPQSSPSPCETLSEILVTSASLPDAYAGESLEALVEADVNLNVKCRQGRNVRSWLRGVLEDKCVSDRSRCWVVLCLARMAIRGAPDSRPWLELSSQYWCSLLERVEHLVSVIVNNEDMQVKLTEVKKALERRVGASLDELDDYLHVYKFGPDTLMALVGYYLEEAHPDASMEEIAGEVDKFLWSYAEAGSVNPDTFMALFKAFPSSSRQSHDTIFGAIEKLLVTKVDEVTPSDQQSLWRLVDPTKLGPAVNERALNIPSFLSQPHVLEMVLQKHSEDLTKVPDTDTQNLRHIMQKVINASLKLLEENSRRSQQIVELQQQHSALHGRQIGHLQDNSCKNSPSSCWRSSLTITQRSMMLETETEGSENSETPSLATVSSTAEPRLNLRDIYSLDQSVD